MEFSQFHQEQQKNCLDNKLLLSKINQHLF